MTLSSAGEPWTANLPGLLTPEECDNCAVYAAVQPVASGEVLQFARTSMTAPWDAFPAFVDRDPMANWGHSCRYILMSRATGESARSKPGILPSPKRNSPGMQSSNPPRCPRPFWRTRALNRREENHV